MENILRDRKSSAIIFQVSVVNGCVALEYLVGGSLEPPMWLTGCVSVTSFGRSTGIVRTPVSYLWLIYDCELRVYEPPEWN